MPPFHRIKNVDILPPMNRTSAIRFFLPGVVLLMGAGSARAALITYNFTGTVSSVDAGLAGTFNTSQTLSGSFTYESSTAGSLSGTQSSGFSDYSNALKDFVMRVGSYTAAPPLLFDLFSGIQITNNFSGTDRFVATSRLTGSQLNGFKPLGFLSLDDTSHGAFSDTRLVNIGDLTGWMSLPNRTGFWYLAFSSNGDSPRITGALTSITLVTPEPAGLSLLGIGFLGLASIKAKRSRWSALRAFLNPRS